MEQIKRRVFNLCTKVRKSRSTDFLRQSQIKWNNPFSGMSLLVKIFSLNFEFQLHI